MISSEPEPERTLRPALKRPVVGISWTRPAQREYSLHAKVQPLSPSRAALNALTKKTIYATLQSAPMKLEALDHLQNPLFSLDVSFVEDEEIRALNFQHRGKNKATDVLSWSQLEGDWMPFPDFIQGEEIMLGDLVISIPTALRQAKELKHDLAQELMFLVAHGTLHLCGYDHNTSARRRAMFGLQDEIVFALKTPHSKLSSATG